MTDRIVSQDELDVLLAPQEGGAAVTRYDFRRPDRVTVEQLRALHLLHERFAHETATSLSAFLRTTMEIDLVQVDQLTYAEFLSALPDSTALYALAMPPLETFATLEISPDIAFTVVNRLLGGRSGGVRPARPLTEIEQNIVDPAVKVLLDQLTLAWRGVTAMQFKIHARDTRPQMLSVTGPNEIVVMFAFSVKVDETQGSLKLCIPAAVFDGAGETFAQGWQQAPRARSAEQSAWLAENLGRVPLVVTAQLTTTMAARDLLALSAGDVLSLGHHAQQPMTINVGHVAAFAGHLVVQNGSLAIRIKHEHDAYGPEEESAA
jgi:flagellar motor switch protein FliM